MCLQVSGFMAGGSVILLFFLLSQNDSQLLVSGLGQVALVVPVLFTPGSLVPYRSLAVRTVSGCEDGVNDGCACSNSTASLLQTDQRSV